MGSQPPVLFLDGETCRCTQLGNLFRLVWLLFLPPSITLLILGVCTLFLSFRSEEERTKKTHIHARRHTHTHTRRAKEGNDEAFKLISSALPFSSDSVGRWHLINSRVKSSPPTLVKRKSLSLSYNKNTRFVFVKWFIGPVVTVSLHVLMFVYRGGGTVGIEWNSRVNAARGWEYIVAISDDDRSSHLFLLLAINRRPSYAEGNGRLVSFFIRSQWPREQPRWWWSLWWWGGPDSIITLRSLSYFFFPSSTASSRFFSSSLSLTPLPFLEKNRWTEG